MEDGIRDFDGKSIESDLNPFVNEQSSQILNKAKPTPNEEEEVPREKKGFLLSYGSVQLENSIMPDQGSTPTFGAIFIVMHAALGAAMLNFPFAIKNAGGIPMAMMIHLLLVIVTGASLVLLAYCADIKRVSVYQEVMHTMLGKWAELFTEVCILLFGVGSTIAYLVVAGDQLEGVTKLTFGEDQFEKHADLYRKLLIFLISSCIALPLSLPRDVSFLQYPGMVSFAAVVYTAFMVVAKYGSRSDNVVVETWPKDGIALLNIIPPIAFGYQCHLSGVAVYCGLKHKNLRNWLKIVSAAFCGCMTLYSAVGIFGYLTFGEIVKEDILENYPPDDVAATIGRGMMMFSVLMSYPIMTFCGRAAVESVYRKVRFGMNDYRAISACKWTAKRYYSETVGWWLVSVTLALVIPDINKVIKPVGALAALFINCLPGLCLLKLSENKTGSPLLHRVQRGVAIGYILLGGFVFGQALTSALLG